MRKQNVSFKSAMRPSAITLLHGYSEDDDLNGFLTVARIVRDIFPVGLCQHNQDALGQAMAWHTADSTEDVPPRLHAVSFFLNAALAINVGDEGTIMRQRLIDIIWVNRKRSDFGNWHEPSKSIVEVPADLLEWLAQIDTSNLEHPLIGAFSRLYGWLALCHDSQKPKPIAMQMTQEEFDRIKDSLSTFDQMDTWINECRPDEEDRQLVSDMFAGLAIEEE